jgi:endonuclease-3 related protein
MKSIDSIVGQPANLRKRDIRRERFPKSALLKKAGDAEREKGPALREFLRRLLSHYGRQNWWPANNRLEVILGAILVQHASWRNAELALEKLRGAGLFSLPRLKRTTKDELLRLIRPSGLYRQKAESILAFVLFLDVQHQGSLRRMFKTPTAELRTQLLAIRGFGPETVDSILLYAAGRPTFVVDAYARRALQRHGFLRGDEGYSVIARMVEPAAKRLRSPIQAGTPRHSPTRMARIRVEPQAQTLKELHAVLVRVGNEFCKAKPQCERCPLVGLLRPS